MMPAPGSLELLGLFVALAPLVGMAVRESADVERPDYSKLQAGSAGALALQEDDGKPVIKPGALSAQADFDIIKNTDGDLWDLNADGDFNIPGDTPTSRTENPNIAGTSVMSGGVVSPTDNAAFTVTIEWRDENDNILLKEPFSSSTSNDFEGSNHAVQFNRLRVMGDIFTLVITDTSGGQNRIRGSLNFHV